MGEAKRKKVIAREFKKRLFGGNFTAHDIFQREQCGVCRFCKTRLGDVLIFMWAHYHDFMRNEPAQAAMIAAQEESGKLPIWNMKYGPMVPLPPRSGISVCNSCKKKVLIDAARLPSYMLVEINEGPGQERPIWTGGTGEEPRVISKKGNLLTTNPPDRKDEASTPDPASSSNSSDLPN